MKIKNYFKLIILIILVLMLIVQLSFFFIFNRWENETEKYIFDAFVKQSLQKVEQIQDYVQNVALRISDNDEIKKYLQEHTKTEFLTHKAEIEKDIKDMIFAIPQICYVAVVDDGAIKFSSTQEYYKTEYDIFPFGDLVKIVAEEVEREGLISLFTKGYNVDNQVFFAFASNIFSENSARDNDMVIVFYQLELSGNNYELLGSKEKIQISIADDKNIIMDSSVPEYIGQSLESTEGADAIANKAKLKKRDWTISCQVFSKHILNSTSVIVAFWLVTIALSIVIIILMSLVMFHIGKSILSIEQDISIVSNGDTNHRLRITTTSELASIAQNVNNMIDLIIEMEENQRITQKKLMLAERVQNQTAMNYLQGQISPHFLYNSMEHIRSIALKSNQEEIAYMVTIMGRCFRYSLDASLYVSIRDDFDNAFDYFNVINMRRKKPVIIDVNIPDDIYSVSIVKMVFQPIIENSLKHGVKFKEDALISILAHENGEYIKIEISDNGVGIEEEKLMSLCQQLREQELNYNVKETEHIGLANINKRLKLFYGTDCGLEIDSKVNGGFITTVTIKKHPPNADKSIM